MNSQMGDSDTADCIEGVVVLLQNELQSAVRQASDSISTFCPFSRV